MTPPGNNHENNDVPLEYWLDQVVWPDAASGLEGRILQAIDAAAVPSFALPAFMIPVRGGLAFGARGLLMMAVVVGLGAGLVTGGVFGGGGDSSRLQSPVYAGSGVALANMYEGDDD